MNLWAIHLTLKKKQKKKQGQRVFIVEMFEAWFPTSSSSLCLISIITTKTDVVIAYIFCSHMLQTFVDKRWFKLIYCWHFNTDCQIVQPFHTHTPPTRTGRKTNISVTVLRLLTHTKKFSKQTSVVTMVKLNVNGMNWAILDRILRHSSLF